MYLINQLRPRGHSERGATIVEAAIILPVLLALVLGIVEFGLVYGKYHDLTNAAREGARFGVAPCPLTLSIASVCTAGQLPSVAQVQARTQQFLSIVNVQGATVSVDPAYGRGLVNNIPLTYTRVQVSSPFTIVYFNYNVTLRTEAVMRNETN